MIRHSCEPGIAHPIMSGSVEIAVRRWLDLLTLGAGLLKAPVALPVISAPYEGGVIRSDARYAELARAVITGAAPPLSVEELESALAR